MFTRCIERIHVLALISQIIDGRRDIELPINIVRIRHSITICIIATHGNIHLGVWVRAIT